MIAGAILLLLLGPQETRRPVPAETARLAALKTIRDVFKEEYSKKAANDRRALARTLLQQATDTKDDAPSEYVLLQESRSLASETGDVETALRAVAELGRRFEVDVLPLRATTLAAAGQAAKNPDDMSACALQFIALADQAVRELDHATAEKALASAATLAKSAKNAPLFSRIDARSKQLSAQKAKLASVKKARETLAMDAENAEANALVGTFVCFGQEDWEKGLALMAKGPKSPARDAAELDLANPSDPAKQAELGDAWWSLSESGPEEDRKPLKRRASVWYAKARSGLAGLARVKVEKRLAEVPLPEAAAPAGVDPASLEAWKPSAPFTLSASKVTLKEALAQLSIAANYPMALGDADPSLRVTYRVDGLGPIPALDALCRAAGVSYTWDDAGIRLKKDKSRDAATLPLGPFLLSGRVVRSSDGKTTSLWLGTDWEPRVRPLLYEITLESVTDDAGNPIEAKVNEGAGLVRNANLMHRISPRYERIERLYWYQDFYALAAPPPIGGKLKSVRGKIDFFLPLKTHWVRFENPVAGATADAGGNLVKLAFFEHYDKTNKWHACFEMEFGAIPADKRFALLAGLIQTPLSFTDAGGRSEVGLLQGTIGGAGSGTKESLARANTSSWSRVMDKSAPPRCVAAPIVTDAWVRSYSFELRDVPYPKPNP